MPKVVTGVLLEAVEPRIKRGSVECKLLVFQPEGGPAVTWKAMSAEREVFDALRLGAPCTLYLSTAWSTLYGVRAPDGTAAFAAWGANPLALVVSIGMIAMGLGTAPLVFPLLAFLAGVAGVFVHLDAASAKRRFRRDGKAAAAVAA